MKYRVKMTPASQPGIPSGLCRLLAPLALLGSSVLPVSSAVLPPSDNTQPPFIGLYAGSPQGGLPGHSGGGIDRGSFTAQHLYRSNLWLEEFIDFKSWNSVAGNDGAVTYGANWKKTNPNGKFILTVPMLIGSGSTPASGVTFAKGIAGDYDVHYLSLANKLVNSGLKDTIIRLGHEFNGGFYPWHVVHNDSQTSFDDRPANYVAFFRRIVGLMRSVPNQEFKFCWNGALLFTNYPLTAAFPGAAYVDYVGVDFYDSSYAGTTSAPTYPYSTNVYPYGTDAATRQQRAFNINKTNTNYGFDAWKAIAVNNGLKMALPEWGVMRRNDGHGGLDDPDFIQRMYNLIHDSNNLIEWHVYFDYQNDIPSKLGRYPTPSGVEGTEFPRSAVKFKELFAFNPLPQNSDIGSVGIAGSGTAVSVTGAGTGYLRGTTDSFHFSARPASADDEFLVQITEMSTAAAAQSGIMVREGSSTANAAYAALFVGNGKCTFQSRATAGGTAVIRNVLGPVSAPVWLRMLKRGNAITAYYSADGLNWTQGGGQTVTLTSPSIGLAVSSGSTTATNLTKMDNVDKYEILTASTTSVAGAIIKDDADSTGITISGTPSTQGTRYLSAFQATGYRDMGAVPCTVAFAPNIPESGLYGVYLRWPQGSDLAYDAPLTVTSADPVANLVANQTIGRYQWVYAGSYQFSQGTAGNVSISRPSTAYHFTLADAAMFVPLKSTLTFEAESIVGITVSSGETASIFTETEASNGVGSKVNSNAQSDFISYPLPNIPAGAYSIRVRYKKFTSRGIFQLFVDGVTQGGTVNEYGATAYDEVNLGTIAFAAAGSHEFKFQVTGKDPASTGLDLTVDSISLVPLPAGGSSLYEVETIPSANITAAAGATAAVFSDTGASGGGGEKLDVTVDNNSFVNFKLSNVAAGSYSAVKVRYKSGPSRGIFQLSIDGVNQGAPRDEYAATAAFVEVNLGARTLTAGDHDFQFMITGHNASSSSYDITIDSIRLEQ